MSDLHHYEGGSWINLKGGPKRRFRVPLVLANLHDVTEAKWGLLQKNRVRRLRIRGVVDPRAKRLVLPGAAVRRLGLRPVGKVKVCYADRRSALRDAVQVVVELQGRSGTFTAVVEPRGRTARIGAIVLTDLDFLVDCGNERLVPRDPRYVVSEIE